MQRDQAKSHSLNFYWVCVKGTVLVPQFLLMGNNLPFEIKRLQFPSLQSQGPGADSQTYKYTVSQMDNSTLLAQ